MITKDLLVTINGKEGNVMTIKTVSKDNKNIITVDGEPGTYDAKDLVEALKEVEKFRIEDGDLTTVPTP